MNQSLQFVSPRRLFSFDDDDVDSEWESQESIDQGNIYDGHQKRLREL